MSNFLNGYDPTNMFDDDYIHNFGHQSHQPSHDTHTHTQIQLDNHSQHSGRFNPDSSNVFDYVLEEHSSMTPAQAHVQAQIQQLQNPTTSLPSPSPSPSNYHVDELKETEIEVIVYDDDEYNRHNKHNKHYKNKQWHWLRWLLLVLLFAIIYYYFFYYHANNDVMTAPTVVPQSRPYNIENARFTV